jgi:hypothetical protein
MRLFSALRTHPAVPAFPVIGLFFAYVFLTSIRDIDRLIVVPWPAQAASYALHAPFPMAAAAVAALAAVEATRLRALGTWELGAARATWRIAVQPVLITVLSVAVLTAGVMAGGLWVVGVLPDLYVLQLMGIVAVLLTAHAVIGFVIGRRFHAMYAAPARSRRGRARSTSAARTSPPPAVNTAATWPGSPSGCPPHGS